MSSPTSFRVSLGGDEVNVSTSRIPLWGRAWKFTVRDVNGNQNVLTQSAWEPEALRMVFETMQPTVPSPYRFALIKIYNLNDESLYDLLFNAEWCTLEAGYQTGPSKSSIIWDGPVLQVLFNRENVVDLTMTFNCMAGLWNMSQQFLNQAFISQKDIVAQFIANTNGNYGDQVSTTADSMISAKQYPRGKTVFGFGNKYTEEIALDNYLNTWIDGAATHLQELDNGKLNTPQVVFAPPLPPDSPALLDDPEITRSIIGVPVASQFGVIFRVLLDPRVKAPMLVGINNSVIQQYKMGPPSATNNTFGVLDQSGNYIAGQVRHYGDTRGNDWYTEITGFTRKYAQTMADGVFLATTK